MTSPDPTVRVRILAEVDGTEIYELGVADLTPEGHQREFADLLRTAADQLEQEGSL